MKAATTAAPFSLVDPHWHAHLKFNGRAPRTLEQLAIARADYEHARRRAEIKAMAAKLAQLDAFAEPLAARGIKLADREIGTYTHGKELRILSPICTRDDKLYAALVELGFREIERRDFGRDQQVKLKHGRSLIVRIDVTAATVEAPPPAPSPTVPHGWTKEENDKFLADSLVVYQRELQAKAAAQATSAPPSLPT